jgi:putative transcriptional regulator
MNKINTIIYNRLHLFRTAHKLSREKLAQDLGVNFQTIGYLERGEYNPSLELALKIAQYFQTPLEQIFSLEEFESILPNLK